MLPNFSSLQLSRNSSLVLTWTSVGGCASVTGTITVKRATYNPPGDCYAGTHCPHDTYYYTLKLTDAREKH